jgi:hypothetical protein
LKRAELFTVVLVASTLAVTDGAALPRLGIAWLAKRLGVEPGEMVAYRNATDEDTSSPDERAK